MFKKIISLFISAALLLSMVNTAVFAEEAAEEAEEVIVEKRIEVLDSASEAVAKKAGLSRSSTFAKSANYSLYWGGEDVKRSVKLSCDKDWSEGEFLEFWVYSPLKTSSSFAIAVISDNKETACTDYYETVVQGNFKGWKIFSIPFSDFAAVHSPVGFNSVDRVELWPSYGTSKVASEAAFYFDSFYVSNVKSEEALKANNDLVLYDFTTGTEKWSYDTRYPNSAVKKSPDTGNYALWWGDLPRQWSGGVGGITLAPKESDWSFYNTLEINLYSEFDSEATIQFVSASDNPNTDSRDYYYEKVAVDWENQRATIRLKIGKTGNQSSGGVPLGWNNITGIELWFTNGTTDESIRTNIYFENIILKNIDYSAQWKEPQYIEPAAETDAWYDFAAKINERYPNNAHPRLLLDSEHLEWLKANYKTDTFLAKAFTKLTDQANTTIDKTHTPTDPSAAADAALTLALMYNLTGEEKYKEEVWKKVEVYTTGAASWNPTNSRLELGDTGRPAALVYDLMYNHWTEEERMIARNAMIIHLLRPERATIITSNGADTQLTNWNPIINSGVGMAALALADTPGYEDATNLVLNRIWRVLPNCFKYFGPDGAGFEGPDYWNYMMANYLIYEASLCSSIGEEDYPLFSVLDEYGMEKTGDFALHVQGATGTFNFYDGRSRGMANGGDFWLARYFDRPEFAGKEYEGGGNDTVRSMLMYRPDERYSSWRDNVPNDYSAGGYVQFGAMRSGFAKGAQTTYVGYKGNGKNPATHARLDAGAFVFDSQNVRFIELPPNEGYNLSEMFGAKRYTYYRNRAEGSNSLVIGLGVNQNTEDAGEKIVNQNMDQKYLSNCEITETKSAEGAAYAVVDLTDAYSQSASSVKRGYALINGRDSFLLQDEITVTGTQDVYSFMHSTANIEVAPDGKSAILTKNGKMVKATLLAPSSAVLESYKAEPVEGSPAVIGDNNDIYKKLTVKTRMTGSGTISILFTPYYGEGNFEFTLEEVLPISQWDKLLLDPVKLDGIYLAGMPLASFTEKQLAYVVSEDSVCEVSASAPAGVSLDITQAEKVGETALIKATDSEHTTVYSVSFSDEAQTRLDEWFYYAPKGYLYSANKAEIPNTMDGSLTSGWSNAGPQWLAIDLGKPKEVSEVLIYWNDNNKRQETFDISVSNDGENWDIVWEGISELSNEMVSYKFDPVVTRYVKIMGYKNTVNDWTSINELYIPSTGSGFSDIEGSWAKKAIEDMAKVGIVEGTTDTTFDPEAPLSRAAYITMLERAFGVEQGTYSGKINDVGEYDWFMPYVEAAYMLGLIPEEMLIGGNFNPNQNITREEICALTMKFWEKYEGEVAPVSVDRFNDKGSIAPWASTYVGKALAERIITGVTPDTFAPLNSATRAQAATILKRIYIKTN